MTRELIIFAVYVHIYYSIEIWPLCYIKRSIIHALFAFLNEDKLQRDAVSEEEAIERIVLLEGRALQWKCI